MLLEYDGMYLRAVEASLQACKKTPISIHQRVIYIPDCFFTKLAKDPYHG